MPALVIVTGDKELDKSLATLIPKLQKSAIRKATRAGAKLVEQDAKKRAPRKTGTLAKHIKVKSLPRSRNSQGHGIVAFMNSSDAFYAVMLEFGTVNRRHRKTGKSTGRIEEGKHVFLRPSLYANETRVRELFVKIMRDEIARLRNV